MFMQTAEIEQLAFRLAPFGGVEYRSSAASMFDSKSDCNSNSLATDASPYGVSFGNEIK